MLCTLHNDPVKPHHQRTKRAVICLLLHAIYDPIAGNDDGDDPVEEDDSTGGELLPSLPEGYILFRCRYLRSEYSASVSTTPDHYQRDGYSVISWSPPPCRRLKP